jgi:hypothetical protein
MMDIRVTPRLLFQSREHVLAENLLDFLYSNIGVNLVSDPDRHPVAAPFHAKASFELHPARGFLFNEGAEALDNLRRATKEARAPDTNRYCHHG